MDSETHFSIVFNIYGGSNQILPNATSATQNYYGDEAELEKDDVSKDKEPALSPEATRLFSYINKVEDLRIYPGTDSRMYQCGGTGQGYS